MAPQRFSPRVPDGISRRDFLNGVLLSAGTAPIGAAWAGQNDDDFRTPAYPPARTGAASTPIPVPCGAAICPRRSTWLT